MARLTAIGLSIFVGLGCDSDSPGGDDDDDVGGVDGGGGGDIDAGASDDITNDDTTWEWIDVPGTTCMDGSATGMGINVNPDSTELVIYMEGGGACFNAFTCSGVAHQNGFDDRDLDAFASEFGTAGLFNRDDTDNPLRTWSYVFLPYCTGDIFAGSNENGFGGRTQVGYYNVGAYLDDLVERFPNLTRVVLTGSSAGGFGATYNYDRVQIAFGDVPVTLINDSGPAAGDDFLTPCLQQLVRNVWGLDETLPEDCDECTQDDGGGLGNIAGFLADKYPDRDFGLISSTRDGVIRLFFGWGWPNCDTPSPPMPESDFEDAIAQMRDEILAAYDNWGVYTIDSGLHVWLLETPLGSTESGGVVLTDWLRGQLRGDSTTVAP